MTTPNSAYRCSACGAEKHFTEFTRKMRSGKNRSVCVACRKPKSVAPNHGFRNRQTRLMTEATPAEQRLIDGLLLVWRKRIVWEFQKPIGPFFADFAIPFAHLVVEIDGGYHEQPAQQALDQKRTLYLESCGWEVLRFSNKAIEERLCSVIAEISRKIGISV